MKILHIITTINKGGSENHLVELVSGQRKNKHDVSVIYLKGNGYWADHLKSLGVKLYTPNIKRYVNIVAFWKVAQWIGKRQFDIIHAHMPPAELFTRIGLILIGNKETPFIITKHNDEPFYRGFAHGFLGRWIAKRSKAVIAISDAVKDYVCRKPLYFPKEKVTRIHYGIDANAFLETNTTNRLKLRHRWQAGEDCYVIGTVARFVPQKALHVLLQAFSDLLYEEQLEHRGDLRLVMVGQGPLEKELKALSKQLKIDKHVHWAGFYEDIPAVMGAFDAFALTSVYEGFGLVLLEAMASGLPIVASNISAIPEVIKDAGILVSPGNSKLVAHALKRVIDTSSLRKELKKLGINRVESFFSLEKMVTQTDAIYQLCHTTKKNY